MKLLIPAAAMFFLISCSSFQYGTISSHLSSAPDGTLKFENDTVLVSYSFRGQSCPVTVRVYNKTSQPLIVHWDRSSVILNARTIPVTNNTSTLLATSETTAIRGNFGVVSSGTIEGIIQNPGQSSFVPPSSYVESRVTVLDSLTSIRKIMHKDIKKAGQNRFYAIDYDEANSPLIFRTYLSYSFQQNPGIHHVENSFWLSKVTHTIVRPDDYEQYHSRADTFFSRKGNYKGLIAVAAVGTVATAFLIDEAVSQVGDPGF